MRRQGKAVWGEPVMDARRCGGLFYALEDAVADQVLQVADEHALGDAGDAAAQFAGAHGLLRETPEDGAFPAAVDDGESGVEGAWRYLFFRNRHCFDPLRADAVRLLTTLSVRGSASADASMLSHG